MEIFYKCKDDTEQRSITIEDYRPPIEFSKGSSPTERFTKTALEYKGKPECGVLIDLYRYLRFSHGLQDRKFEQTLRDASNPEQAYNDFYNGSVFNSDFPYQGEITEAERHQPGKRVYFGGNTNTLGVILFLILRRRKIKNSPQYAILCGILVAFKEIISSKGPAIGKSYSEIMNNPIETSQSPDNYIIALGLTNDIEEITPPERRLMEINKISRNIERSSGLKRLYEYTCQLCNTSLKLGKNEYYCEVHHIKPLGKPHNGPDIISNMIVVCPNCHVLLDNRAINLNKETLRLISPHAIENEYIDYHNESMSIVKMIENLPKPKIPIPEGDLKALYYEDRKEKHGF